MVTPSALNFISLNALRLLSVCTLLLTVAALLDLMVIDAKAINELSPEEKSDVEEDCSYFAGTSVPTHVWGLFWCQLNRTFLILLSIIGLASELNWGGLAERFFNHNIPMLSSSFSTMPLGLLEIMIGTCMLSSYLWMFPLVVAWMLVIIGLLNVILGALFRSSGKDLRSVMTRKRHRADIKEVRWAPPNEKRMTVQTLRPQNIRDNAWQAFEKLRKGKSDTKARTAVGLAGERSGATHLPLWSESDSGPQKSSASSAGIILARANSRSAHPDQATDFPSLETSGQSELLRQRAREANVRAEREQEERERKLFELRRLMRLEDEQEHKAERDLEAGMRRLSDDYGWDEEKDIAIPRADQRAVAQLTREDSNSVAPIWAAHRTRAKAMQIDESPQQYAKTKAHDVVRRAQMSPADGSNVEDQGATGWSREGPPAQAPSQRQATSKKPPSSPTFSNSAREFTARVRRRSLVLSRHLKELKATAMSPKHSKFTVGRGVARTRVPLLPSKTSIGPSIPGRFPRSPTRLANRQRRGTNATATSRSSYYESADEDPTTPVEHEHEHRSDTTFNRHHPASTHYDGADFEFVEVGPPPLPIHPKSHADTARSVVSDKMHAMPRAPARAFVEAGGGRVQKAEPDDIFVRKDSLDSLTSTIRPEPFVLPAAGSHEGHVILHEADGKLDPPSGLPIARQWASEWNTSRDRGGLAGGESDDEVRPTKKRPINTHAAVARTCRNRAERSAFIRPPPPHNTHAPRSRRHIPSSGPPI